MPLGEFGFLEALWTIFIFFIWVAWIFLLIRIVGDIFRRDDARAGKKTLWIFFVLFLPFVGVLTYLVTNGNNMSRREVSQAKAAEAQFSEYVQSVAGSGGATAEIERAKKLLDSGAISQAEFDSIKSKALS